MSFISRSYIKVIDVIKKERKGRIKKKKRVVKDLEIETTTAGCTMKARRGDNDITQIS